MKKVKKIYLHPIPVRIWHWIHAVGIVTLCITGAQIRFPEYVHIFSNYRTAILVHDYTGITVAVDYLIWFLYYIVISRKFRKLYIPTLEDLKTGAIKQALFYGYNYFRGLPNPHHSTPDNKFNPMQKMAYLMIMTLLVPLIIITGLMMLLISHKSMIELGGVKLICGIHFLVAAFFASFVIVHFYLATLGHTFWAHFKAMFTGWEEEGEH